MKKSLNSRNQGLIFLLLMEGSRSVQIIKVRIRIQEAQKHTDPTNPDPTHRSQVRSIY